MPLFQSFRDWKHRDSETNDSFCLHKSDSILLITIAQVNCSSRLLRSRWRIVNDWPCERLALSVDQLTSLTNVSIDHVCAYVDLFRRAFDRWLLHCLRSIVWHVSGCVPYLSIQVGGQFYHGKSTCTYIEIYGWYLCGYTAEEWFLIEDKRNVRLKKKSVVRMTVIMLIKLNVSSSSH